MTLEDETKAQELPADYAFKRKNMSGLVSTAVPVVGDSVLTSGNTGMTSIFFHLANIPASEGEPFTVTCEGKILILLKESTPLNKVIFKRVEVAEPKIASNHVVNLTIKILALGMDAKQPFDLTEKGHHIMVGVLNNGENCIIQQRKDEKFEYVTCDFYCGTLLCLFFVSVVTNKLFCVFVFYLNLCLQYSTIAHCHGKSQQVQQVAHLHQRVQLQARLQLLNNSASTFKVSTLL